MMMTHEMNAGRRSVTRSSTGAAVQSTLYTRDMTKTTIGTVSAKSRISR